MHQIGMMNIEMRALCLDLKSKISGFKNSNKLSNIWPCGNDFNKYYLSQNHIINASFYHKSSGFSINNKSPYQ
jgi:hypothetical protein